MTTLPNAPIRMPGRTASQANLTIPGAPTPLGPTASPQPPAQLTSSDVWRVIRSNIWLIIIMAIVSAGAGYGINSWLKISHSRFTATGAITQEDPVSYDPTQRSSGVDPTTLSINAKTHQLLLSNPVLAADVLKDPDSDVRLTNWYKNQKSDNDALADLADNFIVAAPPESRLLYISMTCSDAASAQTIVLAITDQYIKEQEQANTDRENQRNAALDTRKVVAETDLKNLRVKIADEEAQLNSGGVSGTMNKLSAKDIELQSLLENISKSRLDVDTAQYELTDLTNKINAGQDPTKVAMLINQDPQVAQAIAYKTNLDNYVNSALAANQGPESPSMKALYARSDAATKSYNDAMDAARVKWRDAVLGDAKESLSKNQALVAQMEHSADDLRGQMQGLTNLMQSLMEDEEEKAYSTAKYDKINEEIDMVQNFSARQQFSGVAWAYRPPKPDMPSFPKLPITMALAIGLGLALSLGIAFLRELMDTSIRSPRDISRIGNLNLLGIIPHEDDDRQSAGARLPMVIFEAPHSMMAEQLRQVRTRLQHSSSLDTTRTILITSPSPGDGKSTIACNLASGLALNGRRILLVDANFRRPELHRVFSIGNEQGFSDVLNSLEMFEHAVQETQVPNLYVLPSGPKPSNSTELLESQLLMDFIERALEEFDHVIFDSGPLLFVSETVALAPRVDGVLTVVRARNNSRGVLTRMRDSLKQVRAEHLGVVLNAVRSQGGGYYSRNIRAYYQYQDGGTNGAA